MLLQSNGQKEAAVRDRACAFRILALYITPVSRLRVREVTGDGQSRSVKSTGSLCMDAFEVKPECDRHLMVAHVKERHPQAFFAWVRFQYNARYLSLDDQSPTAGESDGADGGIWKNRIRWISKKSESHERSNHNHVGINRSSTKIAKGANKRSIIAAPKHQQPPVYNIDKNDFRNTVQRLTGSPAPAEPNPNPPANAPKQPNARLHRIRPPPLSFAPPVSLISPIVSASASNLGPPANNGMMTTASVLQLPSDSPTFFSPLPPLTPRDEVWANTSEATNTDLTTLNSGFRQQPEQQQQQQNISAWTDQIPSNNRLHFWHPNPNPNPASTAQFPPMYPSPRTHFFPSPTAQFPLPSPGSQFTIPSPLPSPGSQFPTAQFPLQNFQLPLSPNLFFSPSPGSRFGFPSPLSTSPSPLFPSSPGARFPPASSFTISSPGGFGTPNNLSGRGLNDSPTAGLTALFSFPHGHM
eukprot:Gb_37025 [translate_table: standard]